MSILAAQSRRALRRALLAAPLAVALIAALPGVVRAHVTVWPRSAGRGAFERYVVRVPNEKNVPTTRVEVRFPPEVRISSFLDVEGWQLQVVTDSAGKITGAVWTGSLPPKRFVEFPFIGVNPKEGERIVWPAFQTYEGNEIVEWTGPEGSKNPASVTTLFERPATGAAAGAAPAAGSGSVSSAPLYLSIAALAVGLLSLGLSLRRPAAS